MSEVFPMGRPLRISRVLPLVKVHDLVIETETQLAAAGTEFATLAEEAGTLRSDPKGENFTARERKRPGGK